MNSRFENKVVLITGGSRGIGRAAALAFAREGADVVLTCVQREDCAQEVVEEIREMGRKAIFFKVDVGDYEDVEEMVNEVVSLFGTVDVLVNNAGLGRHGNLQSTTIDEWTTLQGVNLDSVFHCCKTVLPLMKSNGGGSIVNVASISGHIGDPFNLAYSAMKAGVLGLTRSLAVQEAPHGIRVNAVSPGIVDTDMTRKEPPPALEAAVRMVPFGRMAQPQEVASAILFLASDDASYITGETIRVTGGLFT